MVVFVSFKNLTTPISLFILIPEESKQNKQKQKHPYTEINTCYFKHGKSDFQVKA